MRLASFNVENLFDRARAMNLDRWKDGKPVLEAFAKLDQVLGEIDYTAARKKAIVTLMTTLGLDKSDETEFVILRQNRGALVKRSKTAGLVVVANGRADWAGSLELRSEPVNEVGMRNTARVLSELGADILAVIEAENRPVLCAFNTQIVKAVGGTPMPHVMLIDGNDDRGIDVGILSGPKYPLQRMLSHVDDLDDQGKPIFSRDCPEYVFDVGGKPLYVLVNHLKSKGYGSPAASAARRKAQAQRVKAIYENLRQQGIERIAVVGDFNDTPDSDALAPLLQETELKDAFTHPSFDNGGFPGTYGLCSADNKIDYLLLSPALYGKVSAGGVFRKGMWPGVKPKRWDTFEELTQEIHAASDHAAVWVDLAL